MLSPDNLIGLYDLHEHCAVIELIEHLKTNTDNLHVRRKVVSPVWALFRSEFPNNIPVFFGTDELIQILWGLLRGLLLLPNKHCGASCSRCIHGVVGVGKTVLLNALACFASVLPSATTIVSCSYDRDRRTLSELLLGARPVESQLADLDMSKRNRQIENHIASNPHRTFLVLADDINCVYDDVTDRERAKDIIRQFRWFAKEPRCMVVFTGSSGRLPEQLFPTPGSRWHRAGFPNMNNSVYPLQTLFPIRDIDRLAEFCRTCIPSITDVENALHNTGGVGRHLHSYAKDKPNESIVRRQVARMMDGEAFLRLAYLLLGNPAHQVTVREAKQCCSVDELEDMQNRSFILFPGPSGKVELLIPRHMDIIRAELDANATSQALCAYQVTVRGFSTGSSRSDAGAFVLPRVVPGEQPYVPGTQLRSRDGIMVFSGGRFNAEVCVQHLAVEDLTTFSFSVAQDKGIDIVWFEQDKEQLTLVCGQLELGTPTQTITRGSTKTNDPRFLMGIARRGVTSIEALLNAALPKPDKTKFVLFTNKEVKDELPAMRVKGRGVETCIVQGDDFEALLSSQ